MLRYRRGGGRHPEDTDELFPAFHSQSARDCRPRQQGVQVSHMAESLQSDVFVLAGQTVFKVLGTSLQGRALPLPLL